MNTTSRHLILSSFPSSFPSKSGLAFARHIALTLCLSTAIGCGGGGAARGDDSSADAGAAGFGSDTGGRGGASATTGGSGSTAQAGKGGSSNGGEGDSGDDSEARSEVVEVDETFWYYGWRATLGTGTLTVPAGSSVGEVVIDVHLENRWSSTASFGSRLLLTDGQNDYTMGPDSSDFPDILGGRADDVAFVAEVDRDFNLDSATLIVGSPASNQATVPLGTESPDKLVSLEPLDLEASGTLTAGGVRLDIESAWLRADFAASNDQADTEHLFLTVSFSATEVTSSGYGNLLSNNFQLRTPGGTLLATHRAPNEILDQVGSTIDDLSATFIVPKPIDGGYTFIVKGPWADTGSDWVSGEFSFDVPDSGNFPE